MHHRFIWCFYKMGVVLFAAIIAFAAWFYRVWVLLIIPVVFAMIEWIKEQKKKDKYRSQSTRKSDIDKDDPILTM